MGDICPRCGNDVDYCPCDQNIAAELWIPALRVHVRQIYVVGQVPYRSPWYPVFPPPKSDRTTTC